jgi:hypothetical protein
MRILAHQHERNRLSQIKKADLQEATVVSVENGAL